MPSCVLKVLPDHLLEQSAAIAKSFNRANAVPRRTAEGFGLTPQRIALLTSKYWGSKGVHLGVRFLDIGNQSLKNKILAYANKWGQYGNVKFSESTSGEVRLATQQGQGYYSYLGTDILSVPKNEQTLNLDSFSLSTPDSEFDRVVCHEFGHTMGFPHEHERQEILNLLDVEKTVAWFQVHYGWDRQTTMQQVFEPLNPAEIIATSPDVRSIMCYQFDGATTKSGQPIPGGNVIDDTDGGFCAKEYPKEVTPPPPPTGGSTAERVSVSAWCDFKDGAATGVVTGTCSRKPASSTDGPGDINFGGINFFALLDDIRAVVAAIKKLQDNLGIKLFEPIEMEVGISDAHAAASNFFNKIAQSNSANFGA